jgi:hypothetical protein
MFSQPRALNLTAPLGPSYHIIQVLCYSTVMLPMPIGEPLPYPLFLKAPSYALDLAILSRRRRTVNELVGDGALLSMSCSRLLKNNGHGQKDVRYDDE